MPAVVPVEMLDRADEDVLALAFADGADVGDDDFILGQAVLAPQPGAGLGAAELVDGVEADPTGDDPEIAVARVIEVIGLRGRAEEQCPGC